jgi:tetratricopeptide (TPR) repeat protein
MAIPAEWERFVLAPRALAGNERYTVFLSYRSANRAWVLSLYDVLRRYGHTVFIDQVELAAGDELIPRLESALGASQAGILVWSDASRDSAWVSREYQTMERNAGARQNFRFVPVRLDATDLPVFAQNRIFVDFQAYPDGPNGGELLRLLHAVIGKPLSDEAAHFAAAQDDASRKASAQIGAAIRNGKPDQLLALLQNTTPEWRSSAVLACKAAEGLTKLRAYEQAILALEAIQREFPRAVRPKQLQALALNRRAREGRTGSDEDLDKAQAILGELYELGERDPETLGIYGATWAERYKRSRAVADLRQSRDLYAEAFQSARDDYYTGINAASKSVLIGGDADIATGRALAAEVQKIVGTEPTRNDYWKTATVAEVALLQGRYAEAATLYDAAVAMARTEIGSHESTWQQACALMAKLVPTPQERAAIRKAFEHLPDCT